MADRTLSIEGVNPLLLFGFNDTHLKRVEAAFPETTLIARGNSVMLKGEVDDLDRIERTINELILILNRNGNLTENDVDTILGLVKLNGNLPAPNSNDVILYTHQGGVVRAKTAGQVRLVAAARTNDIVFAIGPAGTGKTYTAVALAVATLKARYVKRIVLSRPAVEAGESLGFLPGDMRDKIDPYLRPLYDALEDMLPRDQLRTYLEQRVIEIIPLAFMRGRTLNSAFAILDEAQNATTVQMKMFLTRLGANSRSIITGDVTQTDLPQRTPSGLIQARNILEGVDGIAFCSLDRSDVVRHRLVKDIIQAYEEFNTRPEEG